MTAQEQGRCEEVRPGKKVYLGSMTVQPKKFIKPVQLVYKVIERSSEKDG